MTKSSLGEYVRRMAVKKPWGGRFSSPTDALVDAFTSTIEEDRNIAAEDVRGSIAHARMLGETGIISAEDADLLVQGLTQIETELADGTFVWEQSFEDVHMNVEHRLSQIVGPEVSGRLHTARSRNDQVALDSRLYLKAKMEKVDAALRALEAALIDQAKAHVDTLLPGYTHLQRAQPVRLAHHLLAYQAMFKRDRGRVADALARLDESPLGAGALAGSPHPIDRDRVAELLGFPAVTANSMDTVASRDHFLEVMSASSISMVHLSRIADEIVMWSSAEFSFIEISDAFTTGSSMMPQKKNPDVAELVRGKCGRVVGDLVALLMTVKGLPLTYNRDLQEDKPPLYDSLDTWLASLTIMARMIPAITFRVENMKTALSRGFATATELADHLVTQGVPFRHAHEVVGKIVHHCVGRDLLLEQLTLEDLRGFHASFGDDALEWIDHENAVERRDLPGGPARRRVLEALAAAEADLASA